MSARMRPSFKNNFTYETTVHVSKQAKPSPKTTPFHHFLGEYVMSVSAISKFQTQSKVQTPSTGF